MEIDHQGRTHLHTKLSMLACEECGRPGPNKEWQLFGESGVLCLRCLSKWVEEVNEQLGAKARGPTKDYQAQSGDIYLQEVRSGQWNLHRYMDGVWEYQTMLTQMEADLVATRMRPLGETNDRPFGRRRYYRLFQV